MVLCDDQAMAISVGADLDCFRSRVARSSTRYRLLSVFAALLTDHQEADSSYFGTRPVGLPTTRTDRNRWNLISFLHLIFLVGVSFVAHFFVTLFVTVSLVDVQLMAPLSSRLKWHSTSLCLGTISTHRREIGFAHVWRQASIIARTVGDADVVLGLEHASCWMVPQS